MLKLTKTGIGLLTKQYRSVLRKCLLLNCFILSEIILNNELSFAKENTCESYGGVYTAGYYGVGADCYFKERPIGVNATFKCTQLGCGYYISWVGRPKDYGPYNTGDEKYGLNISQIEKLYSGKYSNFSSVDEALEQLVFGYSALSNSLYNYYYTFRVDEISEHTEFTEELISNKKEMSSLDFMPIKSSSDLRINLIKAEDPLTFSTKTRDDSLDLMEVCHA